MFVTAPNVLIDREVFFRSSDKLDFHLPLVRIKRAKKDFLILRFKYKEVIYEFIVKFNKKRGEVLIELTSHNCNLNNSFPRDIGLNSLVINNKLEIDRIKIENSTNAFNDVFFKINRSLYKILELNKGFDEFNVDHFNKINCAQEQTKKKLKNKIEESKQITAVFLVNDSTKWNSSYIVKCLEELEYFDIKILLAPSGREHELTRVKKEYLLERSFFETLSLPIIDLFDCKDLLYKDIDNVDIDLLFIQQPWGLEEYLQKKWHSCLPVYMPYGYLVYENYWMEYRKMNFHPYLWLYLAQSSMHKQLQLKNSYFPKEKIFVSGYPKLDYFLEALSNSNAEKEKKPVIIYAPHHSLKKESLKISTFDWNYDLIYSYAQSYGSSYWFFRPHGRLKYTVVKNDVMTENEYQNYVDSWSELENAEVSVRDNYLSLFSISDVLITDCASFLGEYLLTGKPVIHLISSNSPVSMNPVGQKISNVYYQVRNRGELALWADADFECNTLIGWLMGFHDTWPLVRSSLLSDI